MFFGGKSKKRRHSRQGKRSRRAGTLLPNAPHPAEAASKVVSGQGEFRSINKANVAFEDNKTGIAHKYSKADLADAANSPHLAKNLVNPVTNIPVHQSHVEQVKAVLHDASEGAQNVGGSRKRRGRKSRKHRRKSRKHSKKSRKYRSGGM